MNGHHRQYSSCDTSIFDLGTIFWQQKWLVFAITFICTLLGAVYIFISKPVYEAKAYIIPPTVSDITLLNKGRTNISKGIEPRLLKITDVYSIFSHILMSEQIKLDFFRNVYLPSLSEKQRSSVPQDRLYSAYYKAILIKENVKSGLISYTLISRSDNALKSRAWVAQYLATASKTATREVLDLVNAENMRTAAYLKQQIDGAIKVARQNRFDRLAQLHEALNIAKASGIEHQMISDASAIDSVPMMYMRGSKVLAAEIKTLNARKSDAAFAYNNLHHLENEYEQYSKITVSPNDVNLYRLDGSIQSSDMPIAPKRVLILSLSMLLGLMISIFLASVRTYRNQSLGKDESNYG